MLKQTIMLMGLAIIIAGCSALARGEAFGSPESDPAPVEQPVVEEPTKPVAETATLAQATEAPVEAEAEPAGDVSPAASLTGLPQPENELGAGEYSWSQLLSRDAIAPIYNPEFTTAGNAPYDDEELVIGVEINGEAKAYAIGPLNGREMVNDTVGGRPILVTW